MPYHVVACSFFLFLSQSNDEQLGEVWFCLHPASTTMVLLYIVYTVVIVTVLINSRSSGGDQANGILLTIKSVLIIYICIYTHCILRHPHLLLIWNQGLMGILLLLGHGVHDISKKNKDNL